MILLIVPHKAKCALDSDTGYQCYCQEGIFLQPVEMLEIWAYEEIIFANSIHPWKCYLLIVFNYDRTIIVL